MCVVPVHHFFPFVMRWTGWHFGPHFEFEFFETNIVGIWCQYRSQLTSWQLYNSNTTPWRGRVFNSLWLSRACCIWASGFEPLSGFLFISTGESADEVNTSAYCSRRCDSLSVRKLLVATFSRQIVIKAIFPEQQRDKSLMESRRWWWWWLMTQLRPMKWWSWWICRTERW